MSPAAVPAAPVSVGVESLLSDGCAAIVTAGGGRSTVNVTGGLSPASPNSFRCSATAVYWWPDTRSTSGVSDHWPNSGGKTVCVLALSGPVALEPSWMLTVTASNSSLVVPLNGGLALLVTPAVGEPIVSSGWAPAAA